MENHHLDSRRDVPVAIAVVAAVTIVGWAFVAKRR